MLNNEFNIRSIENNKFLTNLKNVHGQLGDIILLGKIRTCLRDTRSHLYLHSTCFRIAVGNKVERRRGRRRRGLRRELSWLAVRRAA